MHTNTMDFTKWLQLSSSPSMREISRRTGIAMTTLRRVNECLPLETVRKARELSEATGWRITVADLLGLSKEERKRSR